MESGWNVWVWLVGVVVRRYMVFLILLIPTPLVSVLFLAAASLLFLHLKKMFFVLVPVLSCNKILFIKKKFHAVYTHVRATTGVPPQPFEGCT